MDVLYSGSGHSVTGRLVNAMDVLYPGHYVTERLASASVLFRSTMVQMPIQSSTMHTLYAFFEKLIFTSSKVQVPCLESYSLHVFKKRPKHLRR
jgi:hypothetical protein